MYTLIIRQRAADDAKDAREWYEDKQVGLGDDFLQELNKCYDKLEKWPVSYANIKRNFRQIILRRFPYVVVYKIYDNNVVVYSVFHTSQSTQKKFKK